MESHKIEKEELKDMLVDVRKAYRFLYVFQERVLDLIKYIESYYGTSYIGGYVHYSDPLSHGKDKLDKSAWDFLPMYHFEYQFIVSDPNDNEFILSVLIQCDTGFYDTDNMLNGDKKELEKYKSPEESKSFIHLVLREESDSDINDYKIKLGRVKSTSPYHYPNQNTPSYQGIFVGYKCELFELLNESKTIEFLGEFDKLCEQNGYNLKKVNKQDEQYFV